MDDRIQVAVTVGEPIKPHVDAQLERAGLNVVATRNGMHALEFLRAAGIRCLVVVSKMLPQNLTLQFLSRLHSEFPNCEKTHPVLVGVGEDGRAPLPIDAPCIVGVFKEDDVRSIDSVLKRVLGPIQRQRG